jgi:hypothetical protein
MKCQNCKRKIIIGYDYKCKCEKEFCQRSLPSFEHNCTFDYKEYKKKILSEANIKIEKSKVEVI